MGNMQDDEGMMAIGWAAKDKSGKLEKVEFKLRPVGPDDLLIKVLFCGVCHTDLHQLRNDYGMSHYPMIAGHEVTGLVSEIGENLRGNFAKGDRVGVGCIVGSCEECDACHQSMEQYCDKRKWAYNDVYYDGHPTQGGFANYMVVNHRFVVRIPPNLAMDHAAPLLCAGVTVYSPMMFFGMTTEPQTKRCGVLGLGGVGHMAVLFAKAFGLHVTIISSSPSKREEACQVLGADDFVVSSDHQAMKEMEHTLDYILDTIPSEHQLEPYLALLKVNGQLVMLGVVPTPLQFITSMLILGRRNIGGSFIGGIKETQDMLNFAATGKDVKSMIEVIPIQYINQAMERLEKNDVRYRFVVDIANSI